MTYHKSQTILTAICTILCIHTAVGKKVPVKPDPEKRIEINRSNPAYWQYNDKSVLLIYKQKEKIPPHNSVNYMSFPANPRYQY